ncbi:MAG TPA: hypothetical protein VIE36_12845 [Methylomirabilota bacterium]|jgi:hypothetical protein
MESASIRTLFIVSRQHRDLYGYLKERFAGDEAVEVILDRRTAKAAVIAVSANRRARPEVEAELETRSHAILTLPA